MAPNPDDDAPPRGFSRTLLRKVFQFARPYRRAFIGSIVLLFTLAGLGLLLPMLIRHAVDTYLPAPDAAPALSPEGAFRGVLETGLVLLGIGVVIFVSRYIQLRIINETGQRIIHDLRLAIFKHRLREVIEQWLVKVFSRWQCFNVFAGACFYSDRSFVQRLNVN